MLMKTLVRFVVITFIFAAFLPYETQAELSIPITGADESLSQYICLTTPGVKTYGVKVILSNGSIKNISVKAAKAQVDKQIEAITKKILNVSDLLDSADTPANRNKLKAKLSALRTQRSSLKFIKKQLNLCGKAELEFNESNVPTLLTNTVNNPTFQEPLNHYMFGFKFTVPKNYKGETYCVAVINATTQPPQMGGYLFPESGETEMDAIKNCEDFGAPVGDLCVNGLEDDEAMIVLTRGAFVERVGDCSSLSHCSLNEFRNVVQNFYATTLLTSFRPGRCDE